MPTRREFLKYAGQGLLVITAAPSLLTVVSRNRDLVFSEAAVAAGNDAVLPSRDVLEQAIREAVRYGADYADVFVERSIQRFMQLREGKLADLNYSIDQGVGIRVLYGDQTAYAFCEDFSPENIIETAKLAATAGKGKSVSEPVPLHETILTSTVIPQAIRLRTLSEDKRVEVLKRADAAARAVSPQISDVTAAYWETDKEIVIATSQGTYVHDSQPLIYFMVDALATGNGTRHNGHQRVGMKSGFEMFDRFKPEERGKLAAEEAIRMLSAKDAPSGEMPVIVTNGWGGVLFHEAVGHGLEGDAVTKGLSFFTGRLGEKVASDLVTFVDDATLPGLRGSYNVDDEGVSSARKILIDKGFLRKFMTDRMSAARLGGESTGNGRRESFRHTPLVRMSNTFILNGTSKPQEIIEATKKGVYAKNFVGGVVDTSSGNFTFTVSEAYLVEDGRITAPIKRMTLIGKGPDALQSIDMVADDLDFSPGTCGKGQWVPITSGQPTLRLKKIVVGGTKA